VRAARVTDATTGQLRLSWNRPFDLNGILLGYSLTYTGTYHLSLQHAHQPITVNGLMLKV